MTPIKWTGNKATVIGRWLWRHGFLTAVITIGVSTVIAVGLIAESNRDQDAEFRHDTTLADYASCRSGNRVREANIATVDDIFDAAGRPPGYQDVRDNAGKRYQPRDCSALRDAAIDAGVSESELKEAEASPTVDTVPITAPGEKLTDVEPVFFESCEAARQAGAAPIDEGDAGYRPGLDRDSDGTACE